MKYILLLAILCITINQTVDEDGILILDDETYHKSVHDINNLLVYFYSPWENRCKSFDYDFRLIAREIKKKEMDVTLAKINIPQNRAIAEIYRVRSYPSLHFFQKGDDVTYDGLLRVDDIVFYLMKKTVKKITYINGDEDITSHKTNGRAVVLSHFKSDKGKKYKNFVSAVDDMDDFEIMCGIGDINMELAMDTIMVTNIDGRQFKYEGDFETDDIKSFISTRALPLIVPYDRFWNRFIFSGNHKIRIQAALMSSDMLIRSDQRLRYILEEIALKYKDKLFVTDMNPDVNDMINYFGFSLDQLPIFFIVDMTDHKSIKYIYHGEFEKREMIQFVEDFLQNKLFPFYKSEPIYEHLDGFVKILVSKDFVDVAFDPEKNVLVEYIVPGCRMCSRVEDDYQKLAEHYISSDSIIIARLDMSKNDVKDLVIGQYPAFIMYKAGGDGEKQVAFSGEQMDFPRLKEFVEQNKVPVIKKKTISKEPEEEVPVEKVIQETPTEMEINEEVEKTIEEEVKVDDVKVEMEEKIVENLEEEL